MTSWKNNLAKSLDPHCESNWAARTIKSDEAIS